MTIPRGSGARRLQQVVLKAAVPIFLLDRTARLVFVNPAWEELTGWTATEAVSRLGCRPLGSQSVDAELAAIGDDLAPPREAWSGAACSSRIALQLRNGDRRPHTLEYWPLADRRGALLGLLGFLRPVDDAPIAPTADSRRLRGELLAVRDRYQLQYGLEQLIGAGDAHRRLLDQTRTAAESGMNVLIVGEPGTGKRFVARTIHQRGANAELPLIPFDCAALPPDVLNREIREGLETWPKHATLLIGDVLEVPRDIQGQIVRALDGPIRLLATTAGDPDRALHDQRLRDDLYYRLTGMVLRLRPLRERLDELPLIAQALLERANQRTGRSRAGFTTEALSALGSYDWPGNIRELERVIDRAHASSTGDLIGRDDVPGSIQGNLGAAYNPPRAGPTITPLDTVLEQVERRLIEQALVRARRNKSRAADLLAISRPRLYRRIAELRIPELPGPDPNDDDA